MGIRALKVLDKRPDDAVTAPLFNASIDGDVFRRLGEELATTEEGEGVAEEPSLALASNIDLGALAKLPEGTLGNAFARCFAENGIQPFESPYEVRNDTEFREVVPRDARPSSHRDRLWDRSAWRRGRRSERFHRFRFERHLETPVEEVCRQLRVPPKEMFA